MNIDTLKKLGKAESDLAKMKVQKQKEYLSEFANDPEVAKVIDYMSRFQEEIPLNHPIYKHIETLKTTKDNKNLAKNLITNKVESKKEREAKEDEAELKKKQEKSNEIKSQLNDMLKDLEKETDKIFDFLSKNQKHLSTDMVKIGSILKTRRFLISVKNGFKYAEMK